MKTENENVMPPLKKKTKCSPVITEISLEKEDGTLNTYSTPLYPNRQTFSVEKEGKKVVEGETLPPNDKVIVADVETLENNVVFPEFNKDSSDSLISMLQL